MSEILICNKCGLIKKNPRSLRQHVKDCKLTLSIVEMIRNDYNIKKLSIKKISDIYNIGRTVISNIILVKRSYSEAMKNAREKYPNKFGHTDISKEKLRIKRLEYMKSHPEKTAWRQSNPSYPEKVFNDWISKMEKYIVEREKSFFPYFVDFAIINSMVAIEIDGSQHLLEENKIRDEQKDSLLKSYGWRVLRIPAIEVVNNFNDVIIKVQNFIDNGIVIKSFDFLEEKRKAKLIKIEEETKIKEEKLRKKIDAINILKSSLMNSSIDFSKYGWVSKAAEVLNIKSQKVNKWMKKNMLDFYIESCYKRNP